MMTTPAAPSVESESRTWGMLAHLSLFAHFFVPFGGLIASILIYTIRKDDAIARENQRNALNFEITLAVLGVVATIVYMVAFVAFVTFVASTHPSRTHADALPPTFLFLWIGSIFAFLVVTISTMVMAGFGARAAWLGRVFKYPVSFNFVR